MSRISDHQRRKVFGQPCATKNLVTAETPWGIKVLAHHLVAARFLYACQAASRASSWTPARIDSYACRTIRGASATSLHSYGLAWDLFDRPLPQSVDVWGKTNAPLADFTAAFKKAGFALGAEFGSRKDFPHIEWAAGLPPTATGPEGPVTPAVIDVPLVKPITTSVLGEADGMKISTHFIDIPALDKDGRGWIDIPYPLERVVSAIGHGSSPVDDGYWAPVIVDAQPRGAVTRVTLSGASGGRCGVWYKLIESED